MSLTIWNDWTEADGFLCPSDNDCQWIDQRLSCEDYELEFTPFVSILAICSYQARR